MAINRRCADPGAVSGAAPASGPAARVTQRVPLDAVGDLLTRPARAAIAYCGPDGPECVPVVVHPADGGIRIGVDPEQMPADGLPERIVLAVDDGAYWFELRAAVFRGAVERASSREVDGVVWHDFETRRVAAWDYGQLHEEVEP